MKTNLTRYLTLALVVCILVLSFAACADDKPATDPTPSGNPTGDVTATPTEEADVRIELDIPVKDYDGAEFHVLEWSANGQTDVGFKWIPWEEIDVDEYDGDAISSAVYVRNGEVEKRLGVTITKEYISVDQGYYSTYKNDQISEDNAYQMITYRTTGMTPFIQDGLLTDLNEFEGDVFHFDQPWWVADAVASFTLGQHLYVCASETLLRDKGATACIYFNKKIAADYGSLPNFYELVDNKQWTLEKFISSASVVASSLDGDDRMNSSADMWGVLGKDDTPFYLFNGFGQRFAHVDETGHIEYDYGTEETLTMMMEIFEDVMYQDFNTGFYTLTNAGTLDGNVFITGQCLFDGASLVKNSIDFRDMENDFGILPCPMYDDLQENYSSLVWVHHDCIQGMPLNPGDKEMCALVMEALAWESYYTVFPKFYDTVLLDRSTRDADSKRMLQIVFENRSYDPGQFYCWTWKSPASMPVWTVPSSRAAYSRMPAAATTPIS